MTELSDAKHKKGLIKNFLSSVDKGKLLAHLNDGIRVCDLGCGHGVAVNLMARVFPKVGLPALTPTKRQSEMPGTRLRRRPFLFNPHYLCEIPLQNNFSKHLRNTFHG